MCGVRGIVSVAATIVCGYVAEVEGGLMAGNGTVLRRDT
jgi:hypothetical protein